MYTSLFDFILEIGCRVLPKLPENAGVVKKIKNGIAFGCKSGYSRLSTGFFICYNNKWIERRKLRCLSKLKTWRFVQVFLNNSNQKLFIKMRLSTK